MEDLARHSENPVVKKCPLCGGTLAVHLREVEDPFSRQRFEILRCDGCGLGETCPMPEDLAPYYEDYHGGRHGVTARHCVNRRISFVRRFTHGQKPGRLLDVGCGDGSFLLAAREGGWHVVGSEFNPVAARQRGLDVVTDLGEIDEGAVFDCVTLWHSMEHLRDPLSTLKTIRRHLSAEGVLLIAVPDSHGMQAELFGRRWFHLDVPRHLYHFGRDSMAALLEAADFAPMQWRHQEFEYDLMGWPQSALNGLLATPNVFFHMLMGRSVQCSASEKLASWVGGALFTALGVPLVALGTLFGRGGTLIVAARPGSGARDFA